MPCLDFCKITGRNTKSPEKAHDTDAGFDFFVDLDFPTTTIYPGESLIIPTGFRVFIPEGYVFIAYNKSGVSTKKNLIHGAGAIDHGYTGEITVHVFNVGTIPATIEPGDKIIQFILLQLPDFNVNMMTEEEFYRKYTNPVRGENGFGSTGAR